MIGMLVRLSMDFNSEITKLGKYEMPKIEVSYTDYLKETNKMLGHGVYYSHQRMPKETQMR
jgi:hypothetical protein